MVDPTLRRPLRKTKPTFEFFSHPSTINDVSLTTTDPSFNNNVRYFCSSYANLESFRVDGNRVWLTLLVNRRNGVVFPLYRVEEVARPNPDYFCFHCVVAGWGNHFVSKRRYHMIVPAEGSWGECLGNDALNKGKHLLHGMIHCNGFGHLLSMNANDNIKVSLSSEELMELFDVMCSVLKTRKVTVRDVLREWKMELRLLRSIAYGISWYGEWGYKFCRGSFGVTEQMYNRSIKLLTLLSIHKVLSDFSGDELLSTIIHKYKDECETQLNTIGELLEFMLGLELIPGARPMPKSESMIFTSPHVIMKKDITKKRVIVSNPTKYGISKYSKLSSWAEKLECRYPKRSLLSAAQIVVSILKGGHVNGNRSAKMGRHELREIMTQYIGDTGLIDFVLKSINNVLVEDNIVCRIYDSVTRTFHFVIEPFKEPRTPTSLNNNKTPLPLPLEQPLANSDIMPRPEVVDDISYIYRCILKGHKYDDPVALASKNIIDCKLFVKEWKMEEVKNNMTSWVVCRVLPKNDELMMFFTRPLPPGEIIEVLKGIDMDHLKMKLQCVLRDTYCIMDKFFVEVIEYEKENGKGSCKQVWVKGSELGVENVLRYEAGPCNWKVNCQRCGTKDDDGEDMVYCDGCKVLMHVRCVGVGNSDHNENFLCSNCRI